MAAIHFTAFVAVVILLHYSHFAAADPPPNNNIPVFGDPCAAPEVCGRGRCVHVSNNTLGFVCECETGWRQARLEEDIFLSFLPCVFPNCTLNYTCTDNRPPRDYDYQGRTNISYSDPCAVRNCGGGRCNVTSPFTRSCLCEDGFFNLFNSTTFPCYRRCAFGNECSSLGYSTNTSVVDPFAPIYNHACSLMERAEFAIMIAMATTLVGTVWRNI